jgi:hypothetical protein
MTNSLSVDKRQTLTPTDTRTAVTIPKAIVLTFELLRH